MTFRPYTNALTKQFWSHEIAHIIKFLTSKHPVGRGDSDREHPPPPREDLVVVMLHEITTKRSRSVAHDYV